MNDQKKIGRREMIVRSASVAFGTSLGLSSFCHNANAQEVNQLRVDHKGMFIRDCSLPGESRRDDVFPAHPNGMQVSRNRWLIYYASRSVRGGDDDRSIVYQLRRDTPDGEVIKEGFLEPCIDNWDPFNEGARYIKQNGSPVGFGVPRGAMIDGQPAPHGNLFVVKWRIVGLKLDRQTGRIIHDKDLWRRTQGVEWVQFRLTPNEDDIEIVQPVRSMRQKNYETGEKFCSADVNWMNQTFIQPVPFNDDATEWVDCNHFDRGRVSALKHKYNTERGIYEWTETGSSLYDRPVFEASIVRWENEWLIAARNPNGAGGVPWIRTDDPFSNKSKPQYIGQPKTGVPRTLYLCNDGVLRMFSGEGISSPYKDYRNPLFCWDVDPENNFAMTNRRVVFDAIKAGFSANSKLMVGMCKLLPGFGNKQLLVHRVAPRVYKPSITKEGMADCGIYHARLTYDRVDPAVARAQTPWTFA